MDRCADASDVYRRLGRLIEDLFADPLFAERVCTLDGVVQYQLQDPEAMITLDLRDGPGPSIGYGDSELEPLIVVTTEARVAARIWRGELDATIALARDQISVAGPTERLLAAATASKAVATCVR